MNTPASRSGHSPHAIRPARATDAAAVRMLLSAPTELWGACWVAESDSDRRVIAAAAATSTRREKPLLGPGVMLHVIEPCRRRGTGRALLAELVAHAAAAGGQALYAAHKVEEGGEEFQAWTALGFSPCETVEHHELPLEQFEVQLAPLLARLQSRGSIPAAARMIPLYDADLEAVVKLHLEVMGSDPVTLMQKLRGEAPGSYSARYSKVLLVNDRVVGFILAHRADRDTAYVDANVLHPDFRNGWANIWLKLEATRGALRLGISKFIFTSFDHYTDTRSFTTRFGGVTLKTMALMHRPLSTPA